MTLTLVAIGLAVFPNYRKPPPSAKPPPAIAVVESVYDADEVEEYEDNDITIERHFRRVRLALPNCEIEF